MYLLKKVASIFDGVINLMAVLGVVLFIFIMVSVVYEIIMRDFLHRPSIWVIELTAYSLVFIAFLGTTWVLRREGHVKLDLVLNRLNPGTQSIVNIITSIISAMVCLVIAWFAVKATWTSFELGYTSPTDLAFPKWILLSVISVGSFMLSIQFLRRAYGYIRGRKTSQDR